MREQVVPISTHVVPAACQDWPGALIDLSVCWNLSNLKFLQGEIQNEEVSYSSFRCLLDAYSR